LTSIHHDRNICSVQVSGRRQREEVVVVLQKYHIKYREYRNPTRLNAQRRSMSTPLIMTQRNSHASYTLLNIAIKIVSIMITTAPVPRSTDNETRSRGAA
jgi:hypothetical protein